MAEWIEMFYYNRSWFTLQSPLAMAEWIEICTRTASASTPEQSPLAMAEWIEMDTYNYRFETL